MNKLNYLNNERKLYDYILKHRNEDELLICKDKDLAKIFDVNKITVLRWRKRLKELGLINSSSRFVNGSKHLILAIIEDDNG